MIVLDTSGLLAAIDGAQRFHEAVRAVVERDPGPFLLSPFVLAETDYLLATRVGVDAELALLREVAARAYELVPFGPGEVAEATDLIEQYRPLGIGLADASVVVIAARHGTTRVLTLDERHFRAVRPLRGRTFRILPADA
ncbi:MAG TPA: PIN domain-containing protein [Actinomycetota bacterium]|nr:PIN domain-containing protein [Actinomycetota bacterium]